MKLCTDLEQSKKLAEFLPVESADMYWKNGVYDKYIQCFTPFVGTGAYIDYDYDVPCWSLAALLEVIGIECRMEKTPLDQSGEFTYSIVDNYYNIRTYEEGNPVDACVEMILKLYEQKLL